MRLLAILFTIALAACAATEPPAVEGAGTVTITGADAGEARLWLIDLGTVPVGERAERTITLRNGMASATSLTLGPLEPPFAIDLQRRELAPGESLEVPVRFAPVATGQRETIAYIGHKGGSIDLRLRAAGSALGTECLEVTPPALVFDRAAIDCPATHRSFQVTNTCESPVPIELRISPAGGSFGFAQLAAPALLRKGEVLDTEIAFRPRAKGTQRARLIVGTGSGPALQMDLEGEGLAVPRVEWKDVFPRIPRRLHDLLFVVDGSAGMERWRDGLTDLAERVQMWAYSNWLDLRIGVTTASFVEADGCGGEAGHLLPIGAPEVLTNMTDDLGLRLQALLDVGTCVPPGRGRPLEAAIQAAADFARPDAHLEIVVIAAEDDHGLEPVADYAARLQDAHRRQPLEVSVVHPATGCGLADDGVRLVGFAGFFLGWAAPICTEAWWQSFDYLWNFPRGFYLSRQPLDVDGDGRVTTADIVVEVNDEVLPSNHDGRMVWAYSEQRNAIDFSGFFMPTGDDETVVRYQVEAPTGCAAAPTR